MLERTDAITNEVIETIMFVLANCNVHTFLEINLFQPRPFDRSNSRERLGVASSLAAYCYVCV